MRCLRHFQRRIQTRRYPHRGRVIPSLLAIRRLRYQAGQRRVRGCPIAAFPGQMQVMQQAWTARGETKVSWEFPDYKNEKRSGSASVTQPVHFNDVARRREFGSGRDGGQPGEQRRSVMFLNSSAVLTDRQHWNRRMVITPTRHERLDRFEFVRPPLVR